MLLCTHFTPFICGWSVSCYLTLFNFISVSYHHFNAKSIVLSDVGLTTVPDELLLMTTLANLNLSHNRIRMLPPSISQLHSLIHLDLSDNLLENLPPQLGYLSRLKVKKAKQTNT
ncbi:MAG: leucine-rich repeat domain-containing protein [Gemmatimonadales bacterium]|nr:leucine-rich repeat domain-containing protein [Gemmatimonadales bacterium]